MSKIQKMNDCIYQLNESGVNRWSLLVQRGHNDAGKQIDDDEIEVVTNRVFDCLNAMAGIDDPVGTVVEIRAALKEVVDADDAARKELRALGLLADNDDCTNITERLRALLSRIGGGE